MAIIKRPMAKILSSMAEITSPYGENYISLWRKLFWDGENSLEGDRQWRQREPSVARSATNLPCRCAASTMTSCIAMAMKWRGGPTCGLMPSRRQRSFGRLPQIPASAPTLIQQFKPKAIPVGAPAHDLIPANRSFIFGPQTGSFHLWKDGRSRLNNPHDIVADECRPKSFQFAGSPIIRQATRRRSTTIKFGGSNERHSLRSVDASVDFDCDTCLQ